MKLVFAGTSAPVSVAEDVAPLRAPVLAKGMRIIAGVFALALGSAVLMSATASASPACSGTVLIAEAIELPDLSRTT